MQELRITLTQRSENSFDIIFGVAGPMSEKPPVLLRLMEVFEGTKSEFEELFLVGEEFPQYDITLRCLKTVLQCHDFVSKNKDLSILWNSSTGNTLRVSIYQISDKVKT